MGHNKVIMWLFIFVSVLHIVFTKSKHCRIIIRRLWYLQHSRRYLQYVRILSSIHHVWASETAKLELSLTLTINLKHQNMVRPIHRLVSQADQHSRDCRAFSQTKVLYQNLHTQLCSDTERGRRALEHSPLGEDTSDLAQGEHIYSNFTLKDAGFWQGSNRMPRHKTYRLCSHASTGLQTSKNLSH